MAINEEHIDGPNFLGICSVIDKTKDDFAIGTLNLAHWDQSRLHSQISQLIEGMNQFAVRFATRTSLLKDPDYRYLPVLIDEFETKVFELPEVVDISGNIELVNDVYRIHCWISDKTDNLRQELALATILVAKVYLPQKINKRGFAYKVKQLWTFSNVSDNSFRFKFERKHPLFEEHFPSRAVCPGSLLTELLFKGLKIDFSNTLIELSKVKFIDAVCPDENYKLIIKSDGIKSNSGVFYIQSESKKRYTCGHFATNK
ncbi:hypothetical protein [Vibrio spartinae]|uniref:ApeI dehydratase-like domain-containing protein n=1 Tax=Vibrio spartinae TaxID=1918945 RepID=A0A1N6M5Q5_9VIBR|nr:hypothetical protein [Vibrio spartinae]SIO94762.1 hypothetical protein VSP9026_02492 [Vibrio spartinae]